MMLKIFSGTSNPELAGELAKALKISLSEAEVAVFQNSEIKVTLQESVKDKVCVIIQSTSNPTNNNLMELFLFADALKRNEAKKIVGVIPYFGYARQNVQHRPGECVSANVVIRFLETIGFAEIYTVDLHDEATEGIFTIPFKNLSAFSILAHEIKNYLSDSIKTTVVVSPDQGGVERARQFAVSLYGNKNAEISVIEKKRDLNKIHQSVAIDLYGNVKNKTVILVDDVVTSGGTLINAANLCLERGAKDVLVAVTHHDFTHQSPTKLQQSSIAKIFTTNTIALKTFQKIPKLVVVSVVKSLILAPVFQ